MRRRSLTLTALFLLGAAVLAGCTGSSGSDGGSGVQETAPGAAASGADLSTAQTSLGTVVVTGDGMTAYYFDKDTPGSGVSACAGDCLAAWPPITTDSATPTVDGVTAEVGTIPTPDGRLQVTVDDRPVYTYANDTAPGDVTGQGVNEVWYVVAPDGTEIKDAASSSVGSGY